MPKPRQTTKPTKKKKTGPKGKITVNVNLIETPRRDGKTYLNVVLDESGSMGVVRDSTIAGYRGMNATMTNSFFSHSASSSQMQNEVNIKQ